VIRRTSLRGYRLFLLRSPGLHVLLLETLDAARRIHQLLLSGEERVAAGADFHADIALMRGPRLERVTARADHINFFISGVDSGFHVAGKFLSGEIQV